MPIDIEKAVGAELPEGSSSWGPDDVILYHLGVGAGVPATDSKELEYTYEQSLKVMRQLVPRSNEVPALLEDISTAARRVGLDLATVEPMPVLPGEQFDTYRYKLAVIGGYHPVGQFLSNVGSLNRIIAPVTMAIKLHPVADKTKARVKKGESLIDTEFQVQTYVARTTPYTPPSAVK